MLLNLLRSALKLGVRNRIEMTVLLERIRDDVD